MAESAPRLRALASDFFVYGSGNLLLKALGFLLLPIYTRHLDPADYGLLEIADILVALLGAAVGLGQNHAVERFYLERDAKGRSRLAGAAFAITTLGAFAAAFLLLAFAHPIAAALLGGRPTCAHLVIAFVACRLPFHALAMLSLLVIRLRRERMRYLGLTILVSLVDVGLTLHLVVARGFGVHGVLIGGLVASLLQALLGGWALGREIKPARPEREAIGYGLGLLPATLILILMRILDRALLGLTADIGQLGLYGVAGRFAGLVWLAEASILVAWTPMLFRWLAAGDLYRIRAAGTVATWSLLAAAAFMSVAAVDLIPLMTPEEFHAAIPLVIGLSFAAAGNGAAGIARAGIMISRRTMTATAIDLVSLSLLFFFSFLAIPRWGALGASLAAAAAFWNSAILSHLVSRRLHAATSVDAPILALLGVAAIGVSIIGPAGGTIFFRYGAFGGFLALSALGLWRSVTRRD